MCVKSMTAYIRSQPSRAVSVSDDAEIENEDGEVDVVVVATPRDWYTDRKPSRRSALGDGAAEGVHDPASNAVLVGDGGNVRIHIRMSATLSANSTSDVSWLFNANHCADSVCVTVVTPCSIGIRTATSVHAVDWKPRIQTKNQTSCHTTIHNRFTPI